MIHLSSRAKSRDLRIYRLQCSRSARRSFDSLTPAQDDSFGKKPTHAINALGLLGSIFNETRAFFIKKQFNRDLTKISKNTLTRTRLDRNNRHNA